MRRLLGIAWPMRLPRDPVRLVSLALLALIAAEVAHTAMLLVEGASRAHQPGAGTSPSQPRRSAAVDVHGILQAHLFGVFADPGAADPANAPMSSANLVLSGTIATQDPHRGLAIIKDAGPGNVYKVGDGVGGASLSFVYLDRVILDRGGSFETLRLPRSTLPEAASARTGPRTAPAPAPVAVADADAETPQAAQPHMASDIVRGTPFFGGPGKLRGFRVYPSEDDATKFERSGLRSGDLVIAVNGTTLQDQGARQGEQIFDALKTSSQATVTIQRNGRTQEVTINAAQPGG